ncbi:MAG: hypothetical protein MN733_06855, partial [Nitrososphaera sp.]|nr:hypothetical protein [Nitrososphaera sp.]
EIMAENLAADETDEGFNVLVDSLLASYQAESRDLAEGTALKNAVAWIMQTRRKKVLEQVPDGARRKRFALAGLSVQSCLSIDEAAEEINHILADNPRLSAEAFNSVLRIACRAEELSGEDPDILAQCGYRWLNMGEYHEIYREREDRFRNLNEAVHFVEEVLIYRTPWVLNAIIRIMESALPSENVVELQGLSEWFKLLPHLLRYGVPSKELVWVMSLGIQERKLGLWLLDQFRQAQGQPPLSLRQFVSWSLDNRNTVIEQIKIQWPKYFSLLYSRILDRYERINTLLSE